MPLPRCVTRHMACVVSLSTALVCLLGRQTRILIPTAATGLLQMSSEQSGRCTSYREAWQVGGGQRLPVHPPAWPPAHSRAPETAQRTLPREADGVVEVHARSLRGFPWVPILSPALKRAVIGPRVSAPASLPEQRQEEGKRAAGKEGGCCSHPLTRVLRVPTAIRGLCSSNCRWIHS